MSCALRALTKETPTGGRRRFPARQRSGTMAQLTYDEMRLLRELKNGDRTISGNKPHGGLDRLVKEGYVRAHSLNVSEVRYSITAKGAAALHEADGND